MVAGGESGLGNDDTWTRLWRFAQLSSQAPSCSVLGNYDEFQNVITRYLSRTSRHLRMLRAKLLVFAAPIVHHSVGLPCYSRAHHASQAGCV